MGHGWPGEIPCDYSCTLPKSIGMSHRVRYHEQEDLLQRQVLARLIAGIGGERDLHHVGRQQARHSR